MTRTDEPPRPHAEEAPQAPSEAWPPILETRPATLLRMRAEQAASKQFKRDKRDVHGWVVLDKPVGMTSTHAVSVVKRLFSAKRAGHAGTLDPLASGALPIALGEATKTVPFVMDGRKLYQFTVRWGEERDTDDAEGRVIATSEQRPTPRGDPRAAARLSPAPSSRCRRAIRPSRSRASAPTTSPATARRWNSQARPVEIGRLELIATPDPDHAVLHAECGKGTYVRSLARDIGRALGCFGHVSALRRVAVGPFGRRNHDFTGTIGGPVP